MPTEVKRPLMRRHVPIIFSAGISYIVRVVGYALLLGVPARIGEFYWQRASLDQVDALHAPHDIAMTAIIIVPFVLALFGFGALRRPAIFIAMYVAGVALTAPFALARLASASQ